MPLTQPNYNLHLASIYQKKLWDMARSAARVCDLTPILPLPNINPAVQWPYPAPVPLHPPALRPPNWQCMWAYSRNSWYARPSLSLLKLARDWVLPTEGEGEGSRVCLALGGRDFGILGRGAPLLGGCVGFTAVWDGLMCRDCRRVAS